MPVTMQNREDRILGHQIADKAAALDQISLAWRHPDRHDPDPTMENHMPVILPKSATDREHQHPTNNTSHLEPARSAASTCPVRSRELVGDIVAHEFTRSGRCQPIST